MSKKMKLNLESIRIQSFVTTLSNGEKVKANGAGPVTPECTPVTCMVDCTDFGCPTGMCITEECSRPTGLPECHCGVGTVP